MQALLNEKRCQEVASKEQLFIELLQHPSIKSVRSAGLLIAVELEDNDAVMATLARAIEAGLLSDWFLFAPQCLRIAPPLTISTDEIRAACSALLDCLPSGR